jgi:nitrogenase molybdenum-iron protein alpha chain
MINFSVSRERSKRDLNGKNLTVVSTNLKESDTIFGALDKLRSTIRSAYKRHHPEEIYVVTSCTSAIIGEDVYSVVQEMKNELDIPIGFAAAEGIKSKIWASGFDAYCHAVARTLLVEPEEKANTINYIGFMQIGKEEINPFFERLGLEVVYLTGASTIEDFKKASKSIATWGQCGSQSSYFAGALEQRFGVKYFQSHLPYGGIGFERFYRDLAKYIGKEDIAEQVIAEEREKYRERLESIRNELKGKKAFIALGASFSYEYVRILNELGVEILHAVAYHYDPKLDNETDDDIATVADTKEFVWDDIPTSINDAQEMETYLILKQLKPDFIVSRAHGASPWAVRTGIPALEVSIGIPAMGYKGLVIFGERIVNELKNTNFVRKLGAKYESPFTEKYEKLKPFSFYEEV